VGTKPGTLPCLIVTKQGSVSGFTNQARRYGERPDSQFQERILGMRWTLALNENEMAFTTFKANQFLSDLKIAKERKIN
jgi:hypothetical protein